MTGLPDTSRTSQPALGNPRQIIVAAEVVAHDCCGVASQLEDDLLTRNACGQVEANDVRTRETHDWQARIINESERQFDAHRQNAHGACRQVSLGKDFTEE